MGFHRLPEHFENVRKYSQLYVIEHTDNGYELTTVEVTNSKRISNKFINEEKELSFIYKDKEIIFKVDVTSTEFNYTNSKIFLNIYSDKFLAIKQMQKYLTKLKWANNLKMVITN